MSVCFIIVCDVCVFYNLHVSMYVCVMMMVSAFKSLSTLFESYRVDGRVIMTKDCERIFAMKLCTVMSRINSLAGFEPGTS